MPTTPGSLSGLRLWLKADAITGKTNGSSVDTWIDSSGNSASATNPTSAHQPTYVTNVTNGLPIVRFDGTDDELFSAVSSSAAQQTIVAVVSPASTSGTPGVFGASGQGGLQLRLVSGLPQLLSHWVAEIGIADEPAATAAFQVLVATFSAGNTYSLWLDDELLASGTTTVTLSAGLTAVIGSGSGEDFFAGDIAEMACYDRVLTNGEITSLVSALRQKWIGDGDDGSTPDQSVAAAIISDSFGNHDAIPRGVPAGYSWRTSADNDPDTAYTGFQSYGALNVWGQCFVATSGSANYSVRLQARDPRLYFFDGTTWTRASLTAGSMGGAYWKGDFDPDASQDASPRSDGSGVYSVSLSSLVSSPPDVFHWWWDGMYPRIPIPANTQGIVVRMDMRLVPDDGYSTIGTTSFIASTDADLFATPNTTIDPKGWNDGLPEARMKWVTGDWQHFYNTTMTVAQINATPPSITD